MLHRVVAACLLTSFMMGAAGPVRAQAPTDSARAQALRDFHGPDGTGKDGPLHKAGLDLLTLYHRYQRSGDGTPQASSLRVRDGRVTVDAVAATAPARLRAELERLGMTETALAGRVVSGRLPVEQIPAAAQLESLRGLMPSRPQTRSTMPVSPAPSAPSPISQHDSTNAPADAPSGPMLFLLGSALTVLFLESH